MPETIRFHLDENVGNAIAEGLRRRKIEMTTTFEVGLISASDLEQLAFAKDKERVIFTQDDDFLKLHHQGLEHTGIVYCQQGSRTIGEILRGLILIWAVLEPEDMRSHLEFL
jgi:predicted nuclease of predicted toxin-antitoxin system